MVECEKLAQQLVEAGIPERRAEIVAAVITSNDPYTAIAERFGVQESAIGAHVHHYRQQRDEDDELKEQTPAVERRSGTWPK